MPVVDVPDVVELADDAGSAVTMVTKAAGDEPVTELLVCESQSIFTTTSKHFKFTSMMYHTTFMVYILCVCVCVSVCVCACV